MLQQWNSGRQLRDELTNVRLAAADTSLWSIAATVRQRALSAINDAIRTYPFYTRSVYSSAYLPADGAHVVLPARAERIIEVQALNTSLIGVPLTIFDHQPTELTNLLQVSVSKTVTSAVWVKVEYETRIHEIPDDAALAAALTAGATTVPIHKPTILPGTWPPEGFAELTTPNSVGLSEIFYYNSINPNVGFAADRGLLGTTARAWGASVVVSPVVTFPPEAKSVLMAEAESNMYAFWLSHRALYDQYVALTGDQGLSVNELMAMIRTLEDKAERRRKKIRRIARPGTAHVHVRGDR